MGDVLKMAPRKKGKLERRLMAVRGDLVEKVIWVANRNGKTVYSFVNEVMEQALEAEEMGRSLKEIVELYKLLEIEKKSGAVLMTRERLSFLIEKLYPLEKEALLEKWYDSGQWYGKYLLLRFGEGEPVEMLEKLLHVYAWDAGEIYVSTEGGSVHLRCVAPSHSHEGETELFSRYLEGVMNSLGYNLKRRDLSKGLVLLDFEKET